MPAMCHVKLRDVACLESWLSLYGDADSAQAQGCMSGELVSVLADEQLQSTCRVTLCPVVFMTILLLHDHLNIVR